MYFVDKCHQNGIGVIIDWYRLIFPKTATVWQDLTAQPCMSITTPNKASILTGELIYSITEEMKLKTS